MRSLLFRFCAPVFLLAVFMSHTALHSQEEPRAPGSAEGDVRVQKTWSNAPLASPDGGVFVDAAARPDGGWLAATGGSVFSIGAEGSLVPLGSGDRAALNPGGETFALDRGRDFRLFRADGAPLGGVSGVQPYQYSKPVPGSDLVFSPRVRMIEEMGVVESVRFLRPDGTVVSDVPAPGLRISRLAADRIVYALPSELVARRLDGTELWNANVDVQKLESAADLTILVPRFTAGQVTHFQGPRQISSTPVDGVVWNLAVAPGGRFSAATTKTALYVFQEGALAAEVRLPVAFANTLDVSDRGEVLVGGQGPRGEGSVLLYHWQGHLLWSEQVAIDRSAYRPDVRFAPGGDRFLVLERRGITAYQILRSDLP
jgi:hypothetical protein